MDQFLFAFLVNQRTDLYGGSLENRYRFEKETVQAVRAVFLGPCGCACLTHHEEPGRRIRWKIGSK